MKRKLPLFTAFVLAAMISATVAFASITFDSNTGAGFVGKGDVQYTFNWNNKALQDNAGNVRFRASSTSITTYDWTCDRDAGPQTQERSNTTTTYVQGIIASIGRERNQITGFILSGYDGDPTVSTDHEGPAVGSCPTGWTAIDLTESTQPGGTTLEVSSDGGTTWTTLLEKPVI